MRFDLSSCGVSLYFILFVLFKLFIKIKSVRTVDRVPIRFLLVDASGLVWVPLLNNLQWSTLDSVYYSFARGSLCSLYLRIKHTKIFIYFNPPSPLIYFFLYHVFYFRMTVDTESGEVGLFNEVRAVHKCLKLKYVIERKMMNKP